MPEEKKTFNNKEIIESLTKTFETLLLLLRNNKDDKVDINSYDLFFLESIILYMAEDLSTGNGLAFRYATATLELYKAQEAGNAEDVKMFKDRLMAIDMEMQSIHLKHEMEKKVIYKSN